MNVDACLAVYGGTAAVVTPWVLTRQPAMTTLPRLGVVTWLTAAVSVVGSWFAAAAFLAVQGPAFPRLAGLALLGVLGGRCVWVTARTWREVRTGRARHRAALALVGRPDGRLGVTIVDSPQPAAYCLPGQAGGVVVVTSGAATVLSPSELSAVLAHERAHLAGRHHALTSVCQALSHLVPRLPLLREVRRQVALLLEMRADDVAARRHGRRTVASAIAAMGMNPVHPAALGAGGADAARRAQRLLTPVSTHNRSRVHLSLIAAALAAGPLGMLLSECPHPW
jgi:Zn-dependent protease with chaperone function